MWFDVAPFPSGFSAILSTTFEPCPPGRWSPSGFSLCQPCPAAFACPAVGTTNPLLHPCPIGTYSDPGSSVCVGCPPGRYGDPTGGCSVCYCAPGLGCAAGTVNRTGTPCPRGKFWPGDGGLSSSNKIVDFCLPCPYGTFGATEGLTSAQCSGSCIPRPGYFCPTRVVVSAASSSSVGRRLAAAGPGASVAPSLVDGAWVTTSGGTSPYGEPCPAGKYSTALDAACMPCPPGRYGDTPALTTDACSGECVPLPGSMCAEEETSATGSPCPPGTFAPADGMACVPCPAGTYAAAPGQQECTVCALGRYGEVGAADPLCSGTCQYSPG
jgi:hypothetical protein